MEILVTFCFSTNLGTVTVTDDLQSDELERSGYAVKLKDNLSHSHSYLMMM